MSGGKSQGPGNTGPGNPNGGNFNMGGNFITAGPAPIGGQQNSSLSQVTGGQSNPVPGLPIRGQGFNQSTRMATPGIGRFNPGPRPGYNPMLPGAGQPPQQNPQQNQLGQQIFGTPGNSLNSGGLNFNPAITLYHGPQPQPQPQPNPFPQGPVGGGPIGWQQNPTTGQWNSQNPGLPNYGPGQFPGQGPQMGFGMPPGMGGGKSGGNPLQSIFAGQPQQLGIYQPGLQPSAAGQGSPFQSGAQFTQNT
jgi:hypothetical protein